MLGLEIQINNDTPVTVAAENFSFVLLDTAMRQDDTGYIYAHGLDYSNSYHWISVVPRQGDKVKIQIVESPNPSPPVKTEKQDRKEMLARYEQLKKELEEKIGYNFKDSHLLGHAVTHSSYVNEKHMKKADCNERLEFLAKL